jgi:hypothetical protein
MRLAKRIKVLFVLASRRFQQCEFDFYFIPSEEGDACAPTSLAPIAYFVSDGATNVTIY